MHMAELVEKAKKAAGGSKELQTRLNTYQQRLTDWKAQRREPDTAQFLVLAKIAGYNIPEELIEAANEFRKNKRECLLRSKTKF